MLWLQWTPKVVLNAEFYTKSDALEAELEMENIRHIWQTHLLRALAAMGTIHQK